MIFISTYTDGVPPSNAAWFYKCITEMAFDFRFEKDVLKGLKYSICGLGNSLYEENFNKVAIELNKCFLKMKATPISSLYCCDENTVKSKNGSLEGDFASWEVTFFEKLDKYISNLNNPNGEGLCCKTNSVENKKCCKSVDNGDAESSGCGCNDSADESQNHSDENNEENYETTSDEGDEEGGNYFSDIDDELNEESQELTNGLKKTTKNTKRVTKSKNGLIDMEDLGTVMNRIEKNKKLKQNSKDTNNNNNNGVVKEMVTPLLRQSLEKQGYKIIGTHSGVKLCRWTKSMLRGRGGCYKHTFYGIESHRCMETTPSLACANKCVFCWRHHT